MYFNFSAEGVTPCLDPGIFSDLISDKVRSSIVRSLQSSIHRKTRMPCSSLRCTPGTYPAVLLYFSTGCFNHRVAHALIATFFRRSFPALVSLWVISSPHKVENTV